jgi:hypothetical protein
MTQTLAEFLLARITEDEAHWHRLADILRANAGTDRINFTMGDGGPQVPMKPLVLLAECDAKRRIVERHRWAEEHPDWRDFESEDHFDAALGTLRDLALPYADHESYQPEWRV